jgi:hypothetical protein
MLEAKKNVCVHQRYNILVYDDLSITQYNKFHQIRDLSLRGWAWFHCLFAAWGVKFGVGLGRVTNYFPVLKLTQERGIKNSIV